MPTNYWMKDSTLIPLNVFAISMQSQLPGKIFVTFVCQLLTSPERHNISTWNVKTSLKIVFQSTLKCRTAQKKITIFSPTISETSIVSFVSSLFPQPKYSYSWICKTIKVCALKWDEISWDGNAEGWNESKCQGSLLKSHDLNSWHVTCTSNFFSSFLLSFSHFYPITISYLLLCLDSKPRIFLSPLRQGCEEKNSFSKGRS